MNKKIHLPFLVALVSGLLAATTAALGQSAPIATSGGATGITNSTATIAGTVNPKGAQTVVNFEYGTTTSYGSFSATDTVDDPGSGLTIGSAVTGIIVPTNPAYEFTTGTFEAWFNPDWEPGSLEYNPGIMGLRGANTRFSMHVRNDMEGVEIWNGLAVTRFNASIQRGSWYHIALVATDSQFALYLNGTQIGTTQNGSFGSATGMDFNIGSSNGAEELFRGTVDEVRIWNTAIDVATLRQWLKRDVKPYHPFYANLVGYWQLNENDGDVAGDSSGNGNDGSIDVVSSWSSAERAMPAFANLSGLSSSTTYHYRISGTNSIGTSHGSDSTFTTNDVSGSGTSVDPYLIATLNSLSWITQNPGTWGSYFRQTANINASSTSMWDGGNGFLPIGNDITSFTGHYDGDGHTIDSLFISRSSTDYIGLFGITNNAEIKNIGLTNVNITGGSAVGGVVGYNNEFSTVNNCFSTGSINGSVGVGGLLGNNDFSSSVTNCFSTASVSGSSEVIGGLVGSNSNSSSVNNCYSAGNVNGSDFVGGLVGNNSNSAVIINSYSVGSVNGSEYVGGLVAGNYDATISNSYSTGSVIGSNFAGGLVGENNSTVSGSFWDTVSSGQSNSAAGTGKTTAEMKDQSTFLNAGWDENVWNIGDGINNGYPYLKWQNPGGTPLPVELLSFSVLAAHGRIELNWNTATELNNAGWEVQRSEVSNQKSEVGGQRSEDEAVKGRSGEWVKLGFVEGAGTSNSPKAYSFIDKNLKAGLPAGVSAKARKYSYRLKQIDNDGKFKYSQEVEVVISQTPQMFALMQNYPNPFNPITTIGFTLQESGMTTLKIYDAIGREVATLVNENLETGVYHQRIFDAGNLAAGVYFYTLRSGSFTATKKLVLIK
jgi:hypothetical protein